MKEKASTAVPSNLSVEAPPLCGLTTAPTGIRALNSLQSIFYVGGSRPIFRVPLKRPRVNSDSPEVPRELLRPIRTRGPL